MSIFMFSIVSMGTVIAQEVPNSEQNLSSTSPLDEAPPAQLQTALATFTDNGDGTVTDDATGLMWVKEPDTIGGVWQPGLLVQWWDALKNCETLVYAGYDDWRLPNVRELESLVREDMQSSSLISSAATSANHRYWTSTTCISCTNPMMNSPFYAWFVNRNNGSISFIPKTDLCSAKPVRGPLNSPALPQKIPDTGQTTSFTDIFGEDHDYQSEDHQLSYSDNGNGTITDNRTGLMWIKDPQTIGDAWSKQGNPAPMTWENALTLCADLNFAGYDDWRLSTRTELVSIVDYGTYEPAINTTYFPNTMSEHYWTSTKHPSIEKRAWFVYFYNGYVNVNNKASLYYVRPVRG
jgi:hypothetical protein